MALNLSVLSEIMFPKYNMDLIHLPQDTNVSAGADFVGKFDLYSSLAKACAHTPWIDLPAQF